MKVGRIATITRSGLTGKVIRIKGDEVLLHPKSSKGGNLFPIWVLKSQLGAA